MSEGFYMMNNNLLKLDEVKEILELQVSLYIMKKENIQRCNGDLEKGLFKLSYSELENKFKVSRYKLQTVIKKLTELEIIRPIKLAKSRGDSSIYAYETVFNFNKKSNTVLNTDSSMDKSSDCNGLSDSANTDSNTVSNMYKKEKKKENIKINKYSFNKAICAYTQNDDLVEAINDFVNMRKTMKAPLTDRALSMMLGKLDKLASDDKSKIEIIEQSIFNSWKGIFPIKNAPIGVGGTKKDSYKSNICSTATSNTPKIEVINNFV